MAFYFFKKLTFLVKIQWNGRMNLKGSSFSRTEKTNSCGVVIGYARKNLLNFWKRKMMKTVVFLRLEAMIDDFVFILTNLYNPNTENKQGLHGKKWI